MSNRIRRMSKRRQKIAWRRIVAHKLQAALLPIVGMPYTADTWRTAADLIRPVLEELSGRAPIRIVHEGATLAFFSL